MCHRPTHRSCGAARGNHVGVLMLQPVLVSSRLVLRSQLAKLNAGVSLRVADELTTDLAMEHDVVVFTEGSRDELRRFNEACRSRTVEKTVDGETQKVSAPAAFISVVTMGAYGSVFSDFGPHFTIRDKTGEEVRW